MDLLSNKSGVHAINHSTQHANARNEHFNPILQKTLRFEFFIYHCRIILSLYFLLYRPSSTNWVYFMLCWFVRLQWVFLLPRLFFRSVHGCSPAAGRNGCADWMVK
uniref:Uncharacterized protein n=1 Tax=Schistocephalus solidus TaxID=70667 RepID=A0A0X3NXY4_SCHSO